MRPPWLFAAYLVVLFLVTAAPGGVDAAVLSEIEQYQLISLLQSLNYTNVTLEERNYVWDKIGEFMSDTNQFGYALVFPLFFLVYGGTITAYCIGKCMRACRCGKRKAKKKEVKKRRPKIKVKMTLDDEDPEDDWRFWIGKDLPDERKASIWVPPTDEGELVVQWPKPHRRNKQTRRRLAEYFTANSVYEKGYHTPTKSYVAVHEEEDEYEDQLKQYDEFYEKNQGYYNYMAAVQEQYYSQYQGMQSTWEPPKEEKKVVKGKSKDEAPLTSREVNPNFELL